MPICDDCPCADLPYACVAVARPAPGLCEPTRRARYRAALRAACLVEQHPAGTDRTGQRRVAEARPPAQLARAPYPSLDHLVAPVRLDAAGRPVSTADGVETWRGAAGKKPHEYRIAAAIVHLDTPDLLADVLATLRAQTERPYLIVVDTGSLAVHRRALEAMELECEDLEVHYLRPRGWQCTSQVCAAAMDVAFAVCQSEFCYATHTDVFLKRPDYLGYLAARCDARTPAVGWQMSPRPSWGRDDWSRILSHTASLYHMPSMRRYGVHWNMLKAFEHDEAPVAQPYHTGYPDTEVALGQTLQRCGVGVRWLADPTPGPADPPSVLMLGPEPNEPYENEWLVHERSYTSHAIYHPIHAAGRAGALAAAQVASRARVASWRAGAADEALTVMRRLARARTCPDRTEEGRHG